MDFPAPRKQRFLKISSILFIGPDGFQETVVFVYIVRRIKVMQYTRMCKVQLSFLQWLSTYLLTYNR